MRGHFLVLFGLKWKNRIKEVPNPSSNEVGTRYQPTTTTLPVRTTTRRGDAMPPSRGDQTGLSPQLTHTRLAHHHWRAGWSRFPCFWEFSL
jgi:hypothetical protein